MVALGLSTFLGYFVRVPPRPPYALGYLRCRAAGRAFGMRDVASATSNLVAILTAVFRLLLIVEYFLYTSENM